MKIIPYGRQFLDEEDIEEVIKILRSEYLTTGPVVKLFEDKICEVTGAKYAVAVSNGTAALHLASLVLLNRGDKVITTANSFVATSNSILYAGGVPVFVDIADDGNIDLDKCIELLEKDISIKAVYIVHFSGNPVDYDKLKYIRERYNVKILEDCAHALGAFSGVEKVGSCVYSDCSTFSFHPVKHITTGEGGAITTNDKEVYKRLIALRSHGIIREDFENQEMAFDRNGKQNLWYYEMVDLGFNYRVTDFQSALGISQLRKLEKFIQRRKEIAIKYDRSFDGIEILKPLYRFTENSSYHLYVTRLNFSKFKLTKAELFSMMREKGIGLQVHYIPINRQPYYRKLGYGKEELTNMYRYYEEAISLPIYYGLSDDEQCYVINTIKTIIGEYS
ncbi:MAG: UDP-4-amino-4,6-dideoxy-N-acetyl-beta-L-altrosamine transaminase [Calditerrivibrio sp.]|nr:UDP-4-amino-4,6-dideoxy-N-acetyl-beta-L-altrosamine transaminase [Calditerrivibrio sp.]